MPGIQPRTPSRQLMAVLREQIASGLYPPGHRLPPLKDLSILYGVTRDVMRDALEFLDDEGVIVSRLGDGHYAAIEAGTGRSEQDRLWSTMTAAILDSGLSMREISLRARMSGLVLAHWVQRKRPVTAGDVRRIINALDKEEQS